MKTMMKARACIRRKDSTLLLFLAVAVLVLVLHYMEVLETPILFQHEVNSTIIPLRVSTDPDVHRGVCTFQPLSPKDALEERLLLDSIAWPENPVLSANLSVEQTSDPAHSTFTILPGRGGGRWHVGDQLEVRINMSDFQGRPKKFGGDFFLARLHNKQLGAGVAGQVVDHLNGSYSAVFSLVWEGDAQVEVTLVHPYEAIQVLKRLNSEEPDRISFLSVFRSGSISETTICNVCLRPTQPLCNYTDLRTGEPWFCYKPKNLSCDARINHSKGTYTHTLNATDEKLFQSGVNLKVNIRASGPASVTVLPTKSGQPEVESSIAKVGPSGYYYQGVWHALGGPTVHQFNTSAISQCLKGKVVHMYGDSTVRQYYEFLIAEVPGLKAFDLHNPWEAGPLMALDYANNILVKFRFHAPPAMTVPTSTSEPRHIASEIDGLIGGPNTVVVFGIWAHFGTFPMEIYIRRLLNIRRAVVRLLDRAPDTLVVIRTGGPREMNLYYAINNSDWHTLQCYKVLRFMFEGLNVHLIEAWEMVIAHHLAHNIHPSRPIIENMVNLILSYTCPQ